MPRTEYNREYMRKYRKLNRERCKEGQRISDKRKTDSGYYRRPDRRRKKNAYQNAWRLKSRAFRIGRLAASVRDWSEFFDQLASDEARCIAAHVMMCLASVDSKTARVVNEPSFDYAYIAHHFD